MTIEARSDNSVGEILSALARNTGTLVRKEVELASTELTGKAYGAANDMALLGAGGALALAGLLALMAAAVLGLATRGVPMWITALALGGVSILVGFALLMRAVRAIQRFDPVPRKTVKTLQDDVSWAKEQLQ